MSRKVNDILIYPIKSLPGISLSQGSIKKKGIKLDRRWMLIDENNKFISQREFSNLTQFNIELLEKEMHLFYKNESINIPYKSKSDIAHEVLIWDHKVVANEVSKKLSQWFSTVLDHNVRLVKMTKESSRIKKFLQSPWKSKVSFADGYPILIIGTASLDLLNSKLEHPIKMDRFRGNLIVNTDEPHEEDDWETIIVGSSVLQLIKPCARCQMITIDQQSGLKSVEPTKTLSSYRKFENKINFGINAICIEKGKIKKGDNIILMKN